MSDTSPAQESAAAAPALALSEYRSLVASLPTPTRAQMDAFAKFVCGAHSWYKHLPYYPPGKPLQFFLDPAAGMDLNFHSDRVEATTRLECGFHYSSIPTGEYREKFGHLAFGRTSGTTVYRVAADGTALAPGNDVPAVYDTVARSLRRLPAEVVGAGMAMVSGIVHPESARPQWMLQFANERARATWPEESGGLTTLLELLDYCRMRTEQLRRSDSFSWEVDEQLTRLLAPERRRQHEGMVAAMTRVVELAGAEPAV
jgi:hypothetical protein